MCVHVCVYVSLLVDRKPLIAASNNFLLSKFLTLFFLICRPIWHLTLVIQPISAVIVVIYFWVHFNMEDNIYIYFFTFIYLRIKAKQSKRLIDIMILHHSAKFRNNRSVSYRCCHRLSLQNKNVVLSNGLKTEFLLEKGLVFVC